MAFAQGLYAQSAISYQQQIGYLVRNHVRFPAVPDPAFNFEVGLHVRARRRAWAGLYGFPMVSVALSRQTLGNRAVLGEAWGVLPSLDFSLLSGAARARRWRLEAQVGWGLGYLTKPYDARSNPQNIVIGTHLNAFARIQLEAGFRPNPRLELGAKLAIAHYSNAGIASPNLGANLLQAGLSVRYYLSVDSGRYTCARPAPTFLGKRRIFPMAQASVSFTQKGNIGLFFPIYSAMLGAQKQHNHKHRSGLAVEWAYSSLTRAFYQHLNPDLSSLALPIHRWALWAHHEFLFGHWGLVAGGAIYLNRHLDQRSIFATRLGVNFYWNNQLAAPRHQAWIGLQVRAYMGEAECLGAVLGYAW